MKSFLALLFLIGVVAVNAQTPQRCRSPATWRADVVRMEPTRRTEIRGRIAYDAVLQRIRILENEESPAEPSEFYGQYLYFKERVEYSVNLRTRQCSKRPLNDTFRPIEVPYTANFVDKREIGSNAVAGAGVEVNLWAGDTDEGGRYIGAWTSVGCIPVSDQYYSAQGDFASMFFYNVREGYDPDDFVLPEFCFM